MSRHSLSSASRVSQCNMHTHTTTTREAVGASNFQHVFVGQRMQALMPGNLQQQLSACVRGAADAGVDAWHFFASTTRLLGARCAPLARCGGDEKEERREEKGKERGGKS